VGAGPAAVVEIGSRRPGQNPPHEAARSRVQVEMKEQVRDRECPAEWTERAFMPQLHDVLKRGFDSSSEIQSPLM
jgi:hypothetical protein